MQIAGLRELGLWGFLKKLYRRWSDNAITDRAAQLAYYFVFSLFPFLSFLVTLTAYLPLQGAIQELLARLDELMPGEAMAIVQDQLQKLLTVQRPRLLTVSLVLAVWSASRGVDAIRTALNLAYDVKESRPFWKTQGMAVAITVLGAVVTLVSITLIALGGKAGEWLANQLGVQQIYAMVWAWMRWPITMFLIMLVEAVLYYFPEARPSAASPGASKERSAARRSHLRLLKRRQERRAIEPSPSGEDLPPEELPPEPP